MAKGPRAGTTKYPRTLSTIAASVALLALACQEVNAPTSVEDAAVDDGPIMATKAPQAQAIPGQYIITFADSVSDVPGLAKQLAAQSGATPTYTYSAAMKGFAARLPEQAIEGLRRNPHIKLVEADAMVELSDAQLYADWGLDRLDQRSLPLDNYYNWSNGGAGVNVYIIDSGIRGSHVDFGGRVVSAFTAVNDGNGTNDCLGHGTHVAGTVGGATWGVAKAVRLHSVRVFDCTGSSSGSGLLAAIDWVTKNRVRPAVVNMSLGMGLSATVNTAVQNMINAGVVTVVAAGNSAADACTVSPAAVDQAITVAASNILDAHASFSNTGRCVDLYAPGMSIRSTYYSGDDATAVMTGTSMASPHVAGAAALYLAQNPGASPATVADAIVQSATTGVLTAVPAGSPNRLLFIAAGSSAEPVPAPTPQPPPPTATVDQPPIAAFTASCPANKGSCTFDGRASSDDTGISSYSWNFGDGSSSASASAAVTSHSYAAAKSYTVVLTVTDVTGQVASVQQKVTVKLNGKP